MNTNQLASQLELKRGELKSIFDSYKDASGVLNIPADKVGEVEARNAELKDLNDKYVAAKAVENAEAENLKALDELKSVSRLPIAQPEAEKTAAVKSLGELAAEAGFTKSFNTPVELDWSMKTLMSTGAGYAPFSPRDNVVSPYPLRQLNLLDVIPSQEWNHAAYPFMRETTVTNNAAEKAESAQGSLAAFAESALAYTEVSVPIRNIGHFLPVTEAQLEDVPGLVELLNTRLAYGVRARFETQLVAGAGTGVLIEGMTVVTGVQTQAKGSDDAATAIFKAAQKVRSVGFAEPSAILLHPTDYQTVRLLSNTQGSPLWDGGINYSGVPMLWGIPVIQSTALTQGTAFVADLSYYSAIVRRGVTVEIARMGDDLKNAVKTVRADMRGALAAYRPSAGCKVTGL